MKIGKNMFDLEKALDINDHSPYRVYTTETGAAPGETITVGGRSVPWKGIKGEAFKTYKSPNGAIPWNNLQKAIAISKATAGIYGKTVLTYPDYSQKVVSAHAAAMAQRAHPGFFKTGRTVPGKKPWLHVPTPI